SREKRDFSEEFPRLAVEATAGGPASGVPPAMGHSRGPGSAINAPRQTSGLRRTSLRRAGRRNSADGRIEWKWGSGVTVDGSPSCTQRLRVTRGRSPGIMSTPTCVESRRRRCDFETQDARTRTATGDRDGGGETGATRATAINATGVARTAALYSVRRKH